MSKDNVLEYPKLDNEVITVKNFMVIKEATMKCGDITVLVGEQATGKSLLAKLRYFFWEYQHELMEFLIILSDDPKKFKDIKKYNEISIKMFCDIFPNIESTENRFSAQFQSGDISITIERDKKGADIKIDYSKGLADIIKKAHDIFDDFNKSYNKESEDYDALIKFAKLDRFIPSYNIPKVLYVPAQRLFLATLQDNIFRLLQAGNYNIDELLKRFASFWEIKKRKFSNKSKITHSTEPWFDYANKIIKGNYVHRNDKDYIETTWGGMVELKDASSGQQEVLPLLAAIYGFPRNEKTNQLLIIEEPEAHIYPSPQRALIKLIMLAVREEGCKVMMTTHSPYIPTCLNNEIIISQNRAAQRNEENLTFSAYHISEGKAVDIYDKEDDLIDTNDLDSASQEIMTEYYHALKEHDERTEGKDKSGE